LVLGLWVQREWTIEFAKTALCSSFLVTLRLDRRKRDAFFDDFDLL